MNAIVFNLITPIIWTAVIEELIHLDNAPRIIASNYLGYVLEKLFVRTTVEEYLLHSWSIAEFLGKYQNKSIYLKQKPLRRINPGGGYLIR